MTAQSSAPDVAEHQETTGRSPAPTPVHPAWLPASASAAIGSRRVCVAGDGPLLETVRQEVRRAVAEHGGRVVAAPDGPAPGTDGPAADLVLALVDDAGTRSLGDEGFLVARDGGTTTVRAGQGAGVLAGFFHVLRLGEGAFQGQRIEERHEPAHALRTLDHWDNVDVHPVMGQVERGYSGGSLFYADGAVRTDLSRVREYARLLAASGVNRVTLNNVNVHAREALLLTDDLPDVARLAEAFRPYGIRVQLAVSFAAPLVLGGLGTADPHDPDVARWWAETTRAVYSAVPDFGGYTVKADSEGQPGPFTYGRDHADGANLLALALAPHGGVVHWRAFVYDHRQDWRDRSTDRARAAHDHFAPLDGRFEDNVVVQVKLGPMDFQVREPVSPVLAAMPGTRLAVELQVTQEYTGQQQHVCYLAPQWSRALGFGFRGPGTPTVSETVTGGVAAVSNVGTDPFWTGHPLAQANLFAFGRLAWDPTLAPEAVLDEWARLTFDDPGVTAALHAMMDGSLDTYEAYTAPLGVGFMVRPGHHYGPDVDGYEYTPWGTYHFADRDGVGVDRTRGSGTGFTGQYPQPWADVYESLETCPDELLLFFHHVPYDHVLHSGSTVVQHVYDTHFAGVEQVEAMIAAWDVVGDRVSPDVDARVRERLAEQRRSAVEWRDQVNTYFLRKSGVPDARGRRIY